MTNKYSKGDYSKIEISNLELEIVITALNNPNFRLLFKKELVEDTLETFTEHQKKVVV